VEALATLTTPRCFLALWRENQNEGSSQALSKNALKLHLEGEGLTIGVDFATGFVLELLLAFCFFFFLGLD
jgi:hypothetical protein